MVSCDERQDREFLLLTQDFYKQFKFSSFVNVKLPVKTKTKIKVSQSSSSSSWWWTEQPTGSYISNFIFLFSKHLKKTVFGSTKWATPFVSLFSNQQSTRRKKLILIFIESQLCSPTPQTDSTNQQLRARHSSPSLSHWKLFKLF